MTDFRKGIINIISNRNVHSQEISKNLGKKLQKAGYTPTTTYDENAILNICVGGDGAFLRAVRRYNFPDIPFIGINTGHLGFFQEILPENIDYFIDKFKREDFTVEEVSLVKATITTNRRDYTLTGVNEVTVRTADSKVIHINVYIDNNHLQTFSGDGLLVSTPVGSTAYNFSSGGSIVYPTLNTLQLTPLSPINSQAYRSLPNSSVIPGDIPIRLEPTKRYKNSTLVVVDGKEYRYRNIKDITLSISNRTVKKIILDRDMYWNNLKSKFL